MITKTADAFTSGNYQGSGRWGVFYENNQLTFGVPNKVLVGNYVWKRFNADGTSTTAMTLNTNGNLVMEGAIKAGGLTTLEGATITGRATIGGSDSRGILTVNANTNITYAPNTDPGDGGRFLVMQNVNTTKSANYFSGITLQVAPTLGIGAGGRVLGDIRLVRSGTGSDANFVFSNFDAGSNYIDHFRVGSAGAYLSVLKNTTGVVYSNQGSLIGFNPSDRNLKNTIKPLNYGLDALIKLQPKSFYYNSDSAKQNLTYGLIAQEVKEIIPELVHPISDKSEYLGIKSDQLVPILINAIKELSAQIKELKAQNNDLQKQINLLKKQ
jgi:hypothetical protein